MLHHGFEFVVDHVQLIKRAVAVVLNDILPHIQGVLETQAIEDARPFLPDRPRAPSEKITAFSPGHGHAHLFALLRMLPQELRGLPENIGVKGSAQPPVTRDHEQFGFVSLAFVQQRMRDPARPFRKMTHDVPKLMRVRAGRENAVLGPLELGRRDHFHGFGDFLGIFYGSDLPSQAL